MSEKTITTEKTKPTELQELGVLIKYADYLCKSEALPPTYKNASNVLVALQTGKEMGLQPMQSLRMLYIVNGNIKPWGTAYPFFLKKAGYTINIGKHDKTICEVTVNKGEETYSYTATIADVKRDSKALGFAPKEKLYFHACSRIINYYLPEIMAGMNFDNQVDDFQEIKQAKVEILDNLKVEPETTTGVKAEEAIKIFQEFGAKTGDVKLKTAEESALDFEKMSKNIKNQND